MGEVVIMRETPAPATKRRVVHQRLFRLLAGAVLAPACVPMPVSDPSDAGAWDAGGLDAGLDAGLLTVVRPTALIPIELPVARTQLPVGLAGVAPLYVASTTTGLTLVGGSQGLFTLSSTTFTAISNTEVVGLVQLDARTLVAASTAAVWLYDGALTRSPLSGALGAAAHSALARRNDELWLGSVDAVARYAEGHLFRFASIGAGFAIHTFDSAEQLTVAGPDRARFVLRTVTATTWVVQSLSEERALDLALPMAGERLIGASGGRLFERVPIDATHAAWRPVALTTAPDDPGAEGIEAAALDPSTGALWLVDGAAVLRLETQAGRVAHQARPVSLGRVTSASATRDGALWISDGQVLLRIGSPGAPVTFSGVARFFSDNCARCHSAAGPGRALSTYEQWVANIDRAITQLERGLMPADGQALVGGTVELLRRWRADGLRP